MIDNKNSKKGKSTASQAKVAFLNTFLAIKIIGEFV